MIPNRKQKLVFAFLLGATTLLVVSALCEVALRIRERAFIQGIRDAGESAGVTPSDIPGLNYTLRPGYRHNDIVFNRHGFNMPDRPLEKADGLIRLFVIGDSVTQGVGISATHEAFPNRLEKKLQSAWPDINLEVWNGGVGGYNAEQILIFMKHVIPPFRPDAILYLFNFNDYWEPNQYFHGQPAIPPDQLQEIGRSGLLDWLKRFRVVLLIRDNYNRLVYRIRGYAPVYVDQKIEYPSWQKMKANIAEMKNHALEISTPFAVIVHPNQQFLFRSDSQNRAHRDLVDFLREENIPHLELIESLKPRRRDAIYLPDGNHMRPEGYQLLARIVADWLIENPSIVNIPPHNPAQ
ncbi:MAG TPA: SGNH/GDSL hydrolase family protein [Kiritimatiellia bacterium]|nr:SGNH/GDSL hydrolase family protein [Kiritimatiellia bacterium]